MPKPIPDNYPRVIPHLSVNGAAEAITFYSEVFGATERGERFTTPDGSIAHAELQVGDAVIMLADEDPEFGNRGPHAFGGTPVTIMLYVEDVDATVQRAVQNGATLEQPVTDEFYGDRVGRVTDPFGYAWHVATHVEDVSDEEMAQRAAALFGS
ncbi:PhnB protein [Haloechinothrix alba]|uniref:PhnB protein n=1 Tax=Haloechinothrix alba TaxID=664784 RepID=A0A238YYC6_9PSEU|nr:VOC family protein [Haloechinothrix alba]SNR76115.1 PhnB protein [Haloechinothrix alba]